MMSISYIKVFGERNSGTNYLSSLLKRNVSEVGLGAKFGWKHGLVDHERIAKEGKDTLFLAIFKSPYSWAVSMNGKPHHAPQLYRLPFSEFIRSEWACYSGENFDKRDLSENPIKPEEEMLHERNPNTKKRFGNVLLMRQAKIKSFLKIADVTDKFEVVKYEDLLYTPKQVLNRIINKYDLKRKRPKLVLEAGYQGKNPKIPFKRRKFYLQKEYFNTYTKEDLDYVNQYIDFELESKIGYLKQDSLPKVEENPQNTIGS